MSNENREEFDEGAIEPTEHDADETRRLEERLEELLAEGVLSGSPNHKEIADKKPLNLATQIDRLEAQGIVSSSRGPRGPMLRFLDEQMRNHREADRE